MPFADTRRLFVSVRKGRLLIGVDVKCGLMKRRVLNGCLIITSLLGYLEWGGGNSIFLWQGEIDVLSRLVREPGSAAHPFTIAPLLGQLILVITLFQRKPSRVLTLIGLGCLSLLLVFMFIIGLISLNYKILLSTIPFIVAALLIILEIKRNDPN